MRNSGLIVKPPAFRFYLAAGGFRYGYYIVVCLEASFKIFIAKLLPQAIVFIPFQDDGRQRHTVKRIILDHGIYGHILKTELIANLQLSVK